MNEHLQQLEALRRHPSMQVAPEQRPAIVGEILHHLMRPYFLKRTPVMREKFGETQYQAFMQGLADYCLRGYVDNPEPRLSIEFIKGLHRQFYANAANVAVKAVDGSMTTMVPGEFKTVPVFVKRDGEWCATPFLEDMSLEMERLLVSLHDEGAPLFQRYIKCMLDLTVLHPFPDSNGKVGLVLGDLFLLKQGLHPPFFSKYWWLSKQALDARVGQYVKKPEYDISGFYPLVLGLYAECNLGVGVECQIDEDAADE